MANKALTKKEEFFKVLNLMSTNKVKVKYCRTIKERLRPSVQQESLALPKKPKEKQEAAPSPTPLKEEESQLRGGVSLLKSLKKRKLKRLGAVVAGAGVGGAPSSRSLLSYLKVPSLECREQDSSSEVSFSLIL